MKVDYINAFIAATQTAFGSMVGTEVELGDATLNTSHVTPYDISGFIGLSGDVIGCVVLSFPMDTALATYEAFADEKIDPLDPDFFDAIGELTNMVAGNAKAQFDGLNISISLPTVIMGKHHCVSAPRGVPFISVPCNCNLGNFSVEVAFREQV